MRNSNLERKDCNETLPSWCTTLHGPGSRMATEFLEEVTEQTKESSSASVLDGVCEASAIPVENAWSQWLVERLGYFP